MGTLVPAELLEPRRSPAEPQGRCNYWVYRCVRWIFTASFVLFWTCRVKLRPKSSQIRGVSREKTQMRPIPAILQRIALFITMNRRSITFPCIIPISSNLSKLNYYEMFSKFFFNSVTFLFLNKEIDQFWNEDRTNMIYRL